MPKNFSVISLGCFRNNYDSEIVTARFIDKGYTYISEEKFFSNTNVIPIQCEFLIVNTCGFIDSAKKESLSTIREALRLKKEGRVKKVFVFGCLVQRYRNELEKFFPQIDEWQGVESLSDTYQARTKLSPSCADFLKICEGCRNACSYCSIPLIKGPLQSKSEPAVLREAKFLDAQGTRELNIIGQDITSWGCGLKGGGNLASLLRKIIKTAPHIHWIRLIYTHPAHFSKELIEVIARQQRICKYIDLPIQHINDRILRLMNRTTTKREIVNLIKRIRAAIPGCVIRTSVIVGFPSETEEEFSELLDFLEETQFERLGAFVYSREENTKAYALSGQIHHGTKKKRFDRLMRLQKAIASTVNKRFLNKEVEVLVEAKEGDTFIGRTQYDAPEVDGVVFLKNKRVKVGEFYNARITDVYEYDLVGE